MNDATLGLIIKATLIALMCLIVLFLLLKPFFTCGKCGRISKLWRKSIRDHEAITEVIWCRHCRYECHYTAGEDTGDPVFEVFVSRPLWVWNRANRKTKAKLFPRSVRIGKWPIDEFSQCSLQNQIARSAKVQDGAKDFPHLMKYTNFRVRSVSKTIRTIRNIFVSGVRSKQCPRKFLQSEVYRPHSFLFFLLGRNSVSTPCKNIVASLLIFAGPPGLEPGTTVLETDVLPLKL